MTDMPIRQRGAALVIALVMLAVVLLLGISTASILMLDEHAARNHRARLHAMAAAQAALDEACDEISAGLRVTASAFPAAPGCRSDAEGRGLCHADLKGAAAITQQLTDTASGSAAYGEFSGRHLKLHELAPPRYLIQLLGQAPGSGASGGGNAGTLFRISAIGYGPAHAQAGLQAVVQRHTAANGQAACRRLAWRNLPLTKQAS